MKRTLLFVAMVAVATTVVASPAAAAPASGSGTSLHAVADGTLQDYCKDPNWCGVEWSGPTASTVADGAVTNDYCKDPNWCGVGWIESGASSIIGDALQDWCSPVPFDDCE